ncbi:leucine-rich repeat flightless-interacting protein 1-like isoform X1 [Hypanus sabinus]|uniref:leucine-rich repeat flightless-interacting protein 1-like isoform X1 n=2 Tax=Hypanus sabinus TaxID=79690 RepID=UPI0028C499BB|nr:leucine-rich repeat flightless-interacting protein 1-like isoform X1 [Hypanus sabinus]
METPVNVRRRILSREMSEDENVMIMIKEADAKFNSRKTSLAEAKESCVKKLMQQQQEREELMETEDADFKTQEDFKEKYFDAIESISHLETEKILLGYEVERLKDVLEGTEEELAELHWQCEQITKELEREKVAKYSLLQQINYMKEQLKGRKKSEAIEITATENMDECLQSNLKQEKNLDARKMELKLDDFEVNSVQKFQNSAANLADGEQKQLTNSSFETKHKRKIPEEISNGKHKERSMNTFTRGTDDIYVKESTHLIKDGENITVAENVNHLQYETERFKSNKAMEGSGSETVEPLMLHSEGRDSEYKETEAAKGQEEKELIFEVSKVVLEETAHNENQSEDEAATRGQFCDDSLNTAEEEVKEKIEQKKTIMMQIHNGKNLEIVKGESTEVCVSVTGVLGQGELIQDHGVTPGEPRWEGIEERNREAISADKSHKKLVMESSREDFLDGVARAHDKWMESGRDGEEVTNQFRGMKETISNLAKDGVSMNLKQDLESSIDKINGEDCSRREGEENNNEKARLCQLQENNADKDMNKISTGLDMQGHKTVMGELAEGKGRQTHSNSNTEESSGGKEKGPFEMFVQMITTIMSQKSHAKSEGKMSRKDDEMHGERKEEIKEQNGEHVPANQEQYVVKEKKELESLDADYEEERDNDSSRKRQAESIFQKPGGSKTAQEFEKEMEGVVNDPSDEELYNATELRTATCTEESKPDVEEDPESTPDNDDMGHGQSLNRSESSRRHTKNGETCQVS